VYMTTVDRRRQPGSVRAAFYLSRELRSLGASTQH
jgi:hypothetical protein